MADNVLEIIIRAVDQASKVIEGIGASGSRMVAGLEATFLKVGIALTGIGISCKLMVDDINKAFLSFSGAMTEVKALGQLTDVEFEKMRQKALDLSKTVPLAATDIANAMYSMVSVGYDAAESFEAIDPAAKLAVAGGVDLKLAMDAVINVLKAYESEGMDATTATNIMAKAVGVGKWELDGFLDEMMKNVNVAQSLDMSFEEVAATNVVLQNNFTSSAKAGTSLRTVLSALIDPMAVSRLEKMGVKTKDAEGNFRGLLPIMTDIKAVTESMGSGEKGEFLGQVFGREGVTGAVAILAQLDDIKEYAAEMNDPNFINTQFETKLDSVGAKLEIANNKAEAAKIAFGDAMAPATILAADAVSKLAGFLEALPGPLQTVVGSFLTFGQSLIVIGPLLAGVPGILALMGPASTLVSSAMLGLKASLAGVATSSLFVTGPLATIGVTLGSLLLPIAAVVAASVLLYAAWKTNFLGIRDVAGEAATWIKDRWAGVKETFANLGEAIAPSIDKLKSSMGALFKSVDEVFQKFSGGKSIVEVLKSAFDLLGRIVDAVVRKFGRELVTAINGVVGGLTKLVDFVKKVIDYFGKLADNKVIQFLLKLRDDAAETADVMMDNLFPATEKVNEELDKTPEKADKTSKSLDGTTTAADNTTGAFETLGTEGPAAVKAVGDAVEEETESIIAGMGKWEGAITKVLKGLQDDYANTQMQRLEYQNATIAQLNQFIYSGQGSEYDTMNALQELKNRGVTLGEDQKQIYDYLMEKHYKAKDGTDGGLSKDLSVKESMEGKTGDGGYTPSGGTFTEEEWRDMDANERAAVTNKDAVYQVGDQTYYHGKTTEYMDEKYEQWGPLKGNGTGGGGSGDDEEGGDEYESYDPNDSAPDGMTWTDDGEGGYYSYAAGGGKATKKGKIKVGENGPEILMKPDGSYMLVGKNGEEEIVLEKGAKIIPLIGAGKKAGESNSGTGEGQAEIKPLTEQIDIRKRMSESIAKETEKYKGHLKSVDLATEALEKAKKAHAKLASTQEDAGEAAIKSGTNFGRMGDSIEKTSVNTASRSVSSFRNMGEGMESRMGTTAHGVGSRFDAMGDRSVKSSDVMRRNIEDIFTFMEKRSKATAQEMASSITSDDGCGDGGCGFGNDGTGDTGFNTDTEVDVNPVDWDNLTTPPTGWDWRKGLPKLANGAKILGAGRVIVGDNGPEVLDLGNGATVAPLTGSDAKGGGIDPKELAKALREYGGVRDVHIHVGNLIGVPDKNSLRPLARVIKNLITVEEGNRCNNRRASI